jgi:hypothetical protein
MQIGQPDRLFATEPHQTLIAGNFEWRPIHGPSLPVTPEVELSQDG